MRNHSVFIIENQLSLVVSFALEPIYLQPNVIKTGVLLENTTYKQNFLHPAVCMMQVLDKLRHSGYKVSANRIYSCSAFAVVVYWINKYLVYNTGQLTPDRGRPHFTGISEQQSRPRRRVEIPIGNIYLISLLLISLIS